MPNEKNNSNFEEKTFISLIKEHKIEIPELQRDYAQGREKEKYKAETFLDYLLDGIENNIEKNLDFIYGDLEDDIFIPIDGQQRLTTLFLIYFYLSLKNGEYKEELKNFSYKLRPSSKDFFESITKRDNFEKLKNEIKEKSIKEAITNSNWFFKSWLFDPTVKSVLNMLELIEEKVKDKEIDTRDLENIKFQFLPLKNFGLTDEIYVKMNARGKPLTPFENFKAELEANFFKEDLDLQKKFDNAYLDIFWTIAKEKVKDISEAPKLADKLFYRFLYHLFLSYYLVLNKKELKKRLEGKDFNLNEFIKENPYLKFCNDKDKFCINEKYKEFFQDYIVKFLDKIIDGNIKKDENFKKFFKEILLKEPTGEKKELLEEELTILTFPERAKFFAYFLHIVGDKNDKHFLRVLNNLINNTRIEETDQIINALENIFIFFKNVKEKETLKYITEKETNFIKFFRNEQIKEEVRKAKLLLEDNTWEEAIIEAERHWYLEGQIGFLLKHSKYDINEFKKYYMVFSKLFDENKTLRVKEENWRKVFEKEIFKEFLDEINVNEVEKSLKDMIVNFEFDCSDFRSYFINPPKDSDWENDWEIISDIKNYQILINDNKIYLNQGDTKLTNWNWRRKAELYGYYLYKYLEKLENFDPNPFGDFGYYYTQSENRDDRPCLYFFDWKLKKYDLELDIIFTEDKIIFFLFDYEEKLNKIKLKDFKFTKEGYFGRKGFELTFEREKCYIKKTYKNLNKLFKKLKNSIK